MIAITALTTAKGCWCLGHALLALGKIEMGIIASRLAQKTDQAVTESLESYANQMAERFGLKKEFKLAYNKYEYFTPFGNHLLPGDAGLLIPSSSYSENHAKFFIAKAICSIKSNDPLILHLIPLVISAVATFFLLPTFPIAAYAMGIALGGISHVALSRWAARRNFIHALEVSSPEVKKEILSLYEKLEENVRWNFSLPWQSIVLSKWAVLRWELLRFGSMQEKVELIRASLKLSQSQ